VLHLGPIFILAPIFKEFASGKLTFCKTKIVQKSYFYTSIGYKNHSSLSVPLTRCLHLRIKKYIIIKKTPRAVAFEVLSGDPSTGAWVLDQNGVNLTKLLTSMLLRRFGLELSLQWTNCGPKAHIRQPLTPSWKWYTFQCVIIHRADGMSLQKTPRFTEALGMFFRTKNKTKNN
jgi:hypothetical protein